MKKFFAPMCHCPRCFKEIDLRDCPIVSGRNFEPGTKDPKVLKGPEKNPFKRMSLEALDGTEYRKEDAHRQCTDITCKYLLPYNIERAENMILTVVGESFSGKSHYFAALIHEIRYAWSKDPNEFTSVSCLTPEREKDYDYEKVFKKKEALDATATQKVPDPLIYKIVKGASSKQAVKEFNLMIYDIRGEYFFTSRRDDFANFMYATDGLIFIADPFAIVPMMDELYPCLSVEQQASIRGGVTYAQRRSLADSFHEIMDSIIRDKRLPAGANLSGMPVAIMLSKSDLVGLIPSQQSMNYHFLTPPDYSKQSTEFANVDTGVRNLLKSYQQGHLIGATSRLKTVNFFATSATGGIPINDGFNDVKPLRCLDPFLWMLDHFGIIKAKA